MCTYICGIYVAYMWHICISMFAYMCSVYMYLQVQVYVYIRMCVYYVCIYVHTYRKIARLFHLGRYTCISTFTYMYTHGFTYMYTYTHIQIYVYVYTCMCVYACAPNCSQDRAAVSFVEGYLGRCEYIYMFTFGKV